MLRSIRLRKDSLKRKTDQYYLKLKTSMSFDGKDVSNFTEQLKNFNMYFCTATIIFSNVLFISGMFVHIKKPLVNDSLCSIFNCPNSSIQC